MTLEYLAKHRSSVKLVYPTDKMMCRHFGIRDSSNVLGCTDPNILRPATARKPPFKGYKIYLYMLSSLTHVPLEVRRVERNKAIYNELN
jgi:hypothetical protein